MILIPPPEILTLGLTDYSTTWAQMKQFTYQRTPQTPDQFWCLEHQPVFTQGLAGESKHYLKSTDIPLVQTDRGGQITYHGPGQCIIYPLIDLRRHPYGVNALVSRIEKALILTLQHFHIEAHTDSRSRGVYVQGDKIASIGLRVSKGCSFHGLALNIKMDLEPFEQINPCGLSDIKATQVYTHNPDIEIIEVKRYLLVQLLSELEYDSIT